MVLKNTRGKTEDEANSNVRIRVDNGRELMDVYWNYILKSIVKNKMSMSGAAARTGS